MGSDKEYQERLENISGRIYETLYIYLYKEDDIDEEKLRDKSTDCNFLAGLTNWAIKNIYPERYKDLCIEAILRAHDKLMEKIVFNSQDEENNFGEKFRSKICSHLEFLLEKNKKEKIQIKNYNGIEDFIERFEEIRKKYYLKKILQVKN